MTEAINKAIIDAIFPGITFFEGHAQLAKIAKAAKGIHEAHVLPLRRNLEAIEHRIKTAPPSVSDKDLLSEVRQMILDSLKGAA